MIVLILPSDNNVVKKTKQILWFNPSKTLCITAPEVISPKGILVNSYNLRPIVIAVFCSQVHLMVPAYQIQC